MSGWLQFVSNVIGFASICFTLLINAYLNERRRLVDIAHEQTIMRTALIAELNAIDDALGTRSSLLQRTPSFDDLIFHLFPVDDLFRIYRAYVAKLGLLSAYETKRLVSLYSSLCDRLITINDNIRLLATASSTPGTIILDARDQKHGDEAARIIATLDMCQQSVQDIVDVLERAAAQPPQTLTLRQFIGQFRIK